jgi:superfamily II DNA or RNA helicase/DNA-binding transcriptional regulator YiaG
MALTLDADVAAAGPEAQIVPFPGSVDTGLADQVARAAAGVARIPVEIVQRAVALAKEGGDRGSWRLSALCRGEGPDALFPKRGADIEALLARCNECPVQAACLAAALSEGDKDGIWGGTSGASRRKLRRVLRQAGVLGAVGEQRHLVWSEPGADHEPNESARISNVVRREPWPEQVDAVRAVTPVLRNGGRAQYAMATGTGKTLVSMWSAQALGVREVLVLVPNLGLISQTARVWAANWGRPARWLAVSSDVGTLDVDTTTDPWALNAARSEARRDGVDLVVFATYQSSDVLVTAGGPAWGLAIADEAHHLAGLVDKAFAAVLRGDIASERVLFCTGTRRVLVRGKKGEEVRGMDHPDFGPLVYELTLGEAIRAGRVADYKVIVAGVEAATFRRVAASLEDKVDPHLLAGAIAVVRTMERQKLSSCLSFHTRVERAASFSVLVGKVAELLGPDERPDGPGFSGWVDGTTTGRIRERLLARLEKPAGWGVVANARAFGEGIDVPALEAIAIVDPKNSEVDIAQAVGRALRLPGGSTKTAVVILPVLLVDDAESDDTLGGADARSIEIVSGALRALRNHDGDLGRRLDVTRQDVARLSVDPAAAARARRRCAAAFLRSQVDFDVPGGAAGVLAQSMAFELVRETTSDWEEHFAQLIDWATEHGTAMVPQGEKIPAVGGTFRLGAWVNTQRTLQRRGLLASERASALDTVAGWSWNPLQDSFWQNFNALEEWVRENGAYPIQTTVHNGRRIGWLLNDARSNFRDGKLVAEKVAIFESLPGWSWDPHQDAWDEKFAELEGFVRRVGHAIPTPEDGASEQLVRWTTKQRVAIRTERMDDQRRARLRSLAGWVDDWREAQWESQFRRLERWVASHCAFPRKDGPAGEGDLASWAQVQKTTFVRHKMAIERQERLEAIDGWRWPDQREVIGFEEWLGLLKMFIEREGHAVVPKKKIEGGQELGAWVSRQRTDFNAGRLPEDRIAALEAVEGWTWDASAVHLSGKLAALDAFVAKHGHSRVPQRHVEGKVRLGAWINTLRQRRAGLDVGLVSRLEAQPGWVWDPFSADWEEGFAALSAYVTEYGTSNVATAFVDATGYRVGQWASVQRGEYRKGKLAADRQARLETLAGWVWDLQEQRWEEHFAALCAFAEKFGLSALRSDQEYGDLKIGQWRTVQLRAERNGEMRDDRAQRLEGLAGWSWSQANPERHRRASTGAQLRARREELSLSIKEVAAMLKIGHTTLADYERGRIAAPQAIVDAVLGADLVAA